MDSVDLDIGRPLQIWHWIKAEKKPMAKTECPLHFSKRSHFG